VDSPLVKLSTAQRQALPKSEFLVPSKAPGSGSFPIPDKSHMQNALAVAHGAHGAPKRPAVAAKAKAKLSKTK
jgi:hypothetical protein